MNQRTTNAGAARHMSQETDIVKDVFVEQQKKFRALLDATKDLEIPTSGDKAAIADKMKNDWPGAIMPAFSDVKAASSLGVFGTPKHVIKGSLVDKTDSDWTGDQWAEKLKEIGL